MHRSQLTHAELVAKVTRLVGKTLRYLPRLVYRHGGDTVTVAIKVHDDDIVKVVRTHTTTFGSGTKRGPRDPLNVTIRTRLGRMVRAIGIRYGAVKVEWDRGDLRVFEPTLSLRPAELPGALRRFPAAGLRLPAATTRRYRPLDHFSARRRRRRGR